LGGGSLEVILLKKSKRIRGQPGCMRKSLKPKQSFLKKNRKRPFSRYTFWTETFYGLRKMVTWRAMTTHQALGKTHSMRGDLKRGRLQGALGLIGQ